MKFYLWHTSTTHAFGSVISTVTLSGTWAKFNGFCDSCIPLPFKLRLERIDVPDALLLPREPRREPVKMFVKIKSILIIIDHVNKSLS